MTEASTDPLSRRTPIDAGPSRLRHMPRTIALIYLAFGALWIFFTDRLLVWLQPPPESGSSAADCKGWLFVFVSAVLLFVVLHRYQRASNTATQALLESERRDAAHECRTRAARDRSARGSSKARIGSSNRSPTPCRTTCARLCAACPDSARSFRKPRPQLSTTNPALFAPYSAMRAERMSVLIEDLLEPLAHQPQRTVVPRSSNLSRSAVDAAATHSRALPGTCRQSSPLQPDMMCTATTRLLRIAMDNLLDNAWKYTSTTEHRRRSWSAQTGERQSGVFRSRQRRRLRHGVRRASCSALSSGCIQSPSSRHRHRPRHRAADHRATRWPHLGRGRTGSRRNFLLHTRRGTDATVNATSGALPAPGQHVRLLAP